MDKIKLMAAKSSSSDNELWLSFVTHSEDTADVICKLFDDRLSPHERSYISVRLGEYRELDAAEQNARNFCRLIALLHDIGKLTAAFQSKITNNISGHRELILEKGFDLDRICDPQKTPHSAAGYAILTDLGFSEEFAVIVGAHHGKFAEDNIEESAYPENYYGCRSAQKKEWRSLWKEWVRYALSECGYSSADDVPVPDIELQMILTGLLIMSDWIASNTELFPLTNIFNGVYDRQERVDKAWEKLGLPLNWQAYDVYDVCGMFNERFGFDANTVQAEFMQLISDTSSAGIYIFEAPMGSGKTEAALAAAEILASKLGLGGIFFGMPTQATANGIFGRIKEWAEQQYDGEKHTIRLAHGMTELNEEYQSLFHGTANDIYSDDVFIHDWFEGRKQALLADFVIGTADQFLLASLKQKHVMLRHLGLAGKVVIIDECHAYDSYMNVYLDRTLKWMGAYEIPVIILSATLPPQRRKELVKAYLNTKKEVEIPGDVNSYPVLTWTDLGNVFSRAFETDHESRKISVGTLDEEKLSEFLIEKLSDGGCAAVIVNTVKKAQKIAGLLSEKLNDIEVICFHSRFTASDRAEKEKLLLKRVGKGSSPEERSRLVIAATQVLEQSLDIDLDLMITEICPMDLLLQRSGRLHRHKGRKRPVRTADPLLLILETDRSGTESVYGKWLLEQTEKYLPNELTLPSCIPDLVSKVYSAPQKKSVSWEEYCRMINDKEIKAQKYCIDSDLLKRKGTVLSQLINDNVGNSSEAEAAVRDAAETVEVIILVRGENGMLKFLPWRSGGAELNETAFLSQSEAAAVLRERVRLPAFFSAAYNWDKLIKELKAVPERWRENSLLKGELLLVLDNRLECRLIGRNVRYSIEYGFEEIEEREV